MERNSKGKERLVYEKNIKLADIAFVSPNKIKLELHDKGGQQILFHIG